MTHKSSYEVFSLTFWWMKTSYDDVSFSVLQNIQKLRHFSRLTRLLLFIIFLSEGRVCNLFG